MSAVDAMRNYRMPSPFAGLPPATAHALPRATVLVMYLPVPNRRSSVRRLLGRGLAYVAERAGLRAHFVVGTTAEVERTHVDAELGPDQIGSVPDVDGI